MPRESKLEKDQADNADMNLMLIPTLILTYGKAPDSVTPARILPGINGFLLHSPGAQHMSAAFQEVLQRASLEGHVYEKRMGFKPKEPSRRSTPCIREGQRVPGMMRKYLHFICAVACSP